MTDRCRLGDIAIIIHDNPGCEANLGRVVHVCGPRKVSPTRGTVWRIKPVIGRTITYLDDASNTIMRGKAVGIEHDDIWLLPIRPAADDDQIERVETKPMLQELEAV